MKKILFLFLTSVTLTACQTQAPVQQKCPSCDPPVRHFEVVTKCTNYKEKDLGNGNFSQCRFCTNRIYSNGIDVTETFKNPQTHRMPKKHGFSAKQYKKHPCENK